MNPLRLLILAFIFINTSFSLAQKGRKVLYSSSVTKDLTLDSSYRIMSNNDFSKLPRTAVLVDVQRTCKLAIFIFKDTALTSLRAGGAKEVAEKEKPPGSPFISISGNVTYDYYFQDHSDTPFIANNIHQHTLSTRLDLKIKGKYPLKVYFTSRLTNNNYLKDILNLNVQFNPNSFQNSLTEELKSYLLQQLDTSELSNLRKSLLNHEAEIRSLKGWINSESVKQKIVEAKEAVYVNQLSSNNILSSIENGSFTDRIESFPFQLNKSSAANFYHSLSGRENSDSIPDQILTEFEEKKKELLSLEEKTDSLRTRYKAKTDSLIGYKNAVINLINATKTKGNILKEIDNYSLPDSVLPSRYKAFLSIQKFSIGTANLDYSELSVKNLNVTGLQIEYNPRYYYAIAGGVINNRFMDYLLKQTRGPKQYVGLVRFGKEARNGNSLIVTYYYGRKILYNYYTTDSSFRASIPLPNFNLMGITLENKMKVFENTYITTEIAKSSLPYYRSSTHKSLTGAFNLGKRSNEAYSIKLNSLLKATNTKFEGYFKHYGEDFQSFTLVSTNSRQNAWLVKADQKFFKKQLSVTAMIRKNDFINSFIDQSYVSNTVFKSIQASLRIRNLPVFSGGFYPVSQLTKLNDETYFENIFYTLTGNLSYSYNRRKTPMNSTITYMRFYNKPSDSGFIYYNTQNLLLSHSIYFPKLTIQSGFSRAVNTTYRLSTWNEHVQWNCLQWLSFGGGLKYNYQSLMSKAQIGYQFNGMLKIKKLGNIQCRIEKIYIPTLNKELVPNNIGRFTYFKTF